MTRRRARGPPAPSRRCTAPATRTRAELPGRTPVTPSKLAVAALVTAPLLPVTVTVPAEAAGAATVQTAATHHSRHWLHCHTSTRPCDPHRPAPRTATSGARAKVLARARAALGRPYRYGAAGPYSFDCSGLVDYAMKAAGKRLPRTSGAIAAAGRSVTRARPGDVIVYWAGGRATHVGIVSAVTTAGRVAMTIVATHTGDVVRLQRPYSSAITVRAFLT